MPRYATKRDANHAEVIGIFEKFDCSVIDCASGGIGWDLIVGYKTQAIMIEVKNPFRSEAQRKLTPAEHSAHINWRGPKAIVTHNEDAVLVAKLLRARHFSVVSDAIADAASA